MEGAGGGVAANFNGNLLVLDAIPDSVPNKSSNDRKFVVCHQKKLHEATVPSLLLQPFPNKSIPFASIINARYSLKKNDEIHITSIKSIALMSDIERFSASGISKAFDKETNQNLIICNALTNGCFTYLEWEYSTPAVYNDVLGIITDDLENPQLPEQSIGRLICSINVRKLSNEWHFFIVNVKSFEKVLSLTMSAQLEKGEHYGLVTREECEEKRDLRLVSSRDFPRDVRIFKSGSHCCIPNEHAWKSKKAHDHSKCINCGIGEANLLGKSVAIRMTKCRGMSVSCSHDVPSSSSSSPIVSEGNHVDGRFIREDVTQLMVNVNQGFVEVETISEYLGHHDHNGVPLLWSHDLEFIVDFSRIFQDKPFGLYIVKVVRFHRKNIFAKWRLARRDPIVRSLQTTFHSRLSHSVNLSMFGVDAPPSVPSVDNQSNQYSFSRFGADVKSCCLPRTDSLDNLLLFDAVFHQATVEMNKMELVEIFEDDESMWSHHDTLAIKIVEEADVETIIDENSNDVLA